MSELEGAKVSLRIAYSIKKVLKSGIKPQNELKLPTVQIGWTGMV